MGLAEILNAGSGRRRKVKRVHCISNLQVLLLVAVGLIQNSESHGAQRVPSSLCFVIADTRLFLRDLLSTEHHTICGTRKRSTVQDFEMAPQVVLFAFTGSHRHLRAIMRTSAQSEDFDAGDDDAFRNWSCRDGTEDVIANGNERSQRSLGTVEDRLRHVKAKLKAAREDRSITMTEMEENWEEVLGADVNKELKLRMWKDKASAAREKVWHAGLGRISILIFHINHGAHGQCAAHACEDAMVAVRGVSPEE